MPDRQGIRVGDAERQEVVAQLRTHLGAGRLELDEFEERAAHALAARTVADLVPLTADLPAVRSRQKGPPIRQRERRPVEGRELAWRIHLAVWGVLSALFALIWLFAGAGHFWPVWLIMGIGLSVGIHGAVKRAVER